MSNQAIGNAEAEIRALNQQWESRFNDRDAAGLVRLFTEDCVRLPQGGPATVGHAALEAVYNREFAGVWATRFNVAITTIEVVVAGDYAFARGSDTLTQYEYGRKMEDTGKWMAAYRREPDGAWKYFWSTSNSNS